MSLFLEPLYWFLGKNSSIAVLLLACILSIYSNDAYSGFNPIDTFAGMKPVWSDKSSFAVVGVNGKMRGTGTVIFVDDQVLVLTNSHLIQGATDILVEVPSQELSVIDVGSSRLRKINVNEDRYLKARLVFDDPILDFSLLSINDVFSENTKISLNISAHRNGRICTGKLKDCQPGFYSYVPSFGFRDNQIVAMIDGRPKNISLVLGGTVGLEEDLFIAGQSGKVRTIPAYTRPGVSGGAFYLNGRLDSLVTKVSYSMNPLVVATPLSKIADRLSGKLNSPYAEWIQSKGKSRLRIALGKDTIEVFSQGIGIGNAGDGGTTGNGGDQGGTTGNGGEKTGEDIKTNPNSKYIKIWQSTTFGNTAIVLNPFWQESHAVTVNGKDVQVIEVIDTLDSSNKFFQSPTLANILFYYHHSHRYKVTYHYPDSLVYQKTVLPKRDQIDQQVLKFRFFRQLFDGSGKFELINPRLDAVESISDTRKTSSDLFAISLNLAQSIEIMNLKYVENIHIKMSNDRKRIDLVLEEFNQNNSIPITLHSKESSLERDTFKSNDGSVKAVILYEPSDLVKINRIFVMVGPLLIELGHCLSVSEGCE